MPVSPREVYRALHAVYNPAGTPHSPVTGQLAQPKSAPASGQQQHRQRQRQQQQQQQQQKKLKKQQKKEQRKEQRKQQQKEQKKQQKQQQQTSTNGAGRQMKAASMARTGTNDALSASQLRAARGSEAGGEGPAPVVGRCSLFVKKLPAECTEADVAAAFAAFGTLPGLLTRHCATGSLALRHRCHCRRR